LWGNPPRGTAVVPPDFHRFRASPRDMTAAISASAFFLFALVALPIFRSSPHQYRER
jgi:hypothetical protein